MSSRGRQWVVSHGTFVLIVILSIGLWVVAGEPPLTSRAPQAPGGDRRAGPGVRSAAAGPVGAVGAKPAQVVPAAQACP